MANPILKATKREITGTGKLNAVRAAGLVPAVIYGAEVGENISIQFAKADLRIILNEQPTECFLVDIDLDGKTITTLVKDIQRNFLTDTVTHMDLLAVTDETIVQTRVPLKLIGTAAGVGMGGVVHQIVHEIPVKCAVKNIPCCIEADITSVGMKESIRLREVTLPENITTRYNGTVVLASVIKP